MIVSGARTVFRGLLAQRGRAVAVCAAVVGVCGLWAVALAGSAAAAGTKVAFTTQGCTTWQVPAGVSSVQIHATGAAGSAGTGAGGAGGLGDRVSGTLSGLAGGTQVLDVCVDQGATSGSANGSGGSGGSGGGASGVGLGSDFSSPVLIAGAGGGGGGGGPVSGAAGGNAGTPVAQPGGTATNAGDDFGGGGGGDNTTMMGGAGGVNNGSSEAMAECIGGTGGTSGPAGPGSGGAGGGSVCIAAYGGAGGAGYFGGGGGASGAGGGGGGGGSDFCATSITSCIVSSGAGTQTTAGGGPGYARVTITYTPPPPYQPDAQIKLSSDTNYLGVGIHNTTGAGQTRTTTTARGKSATFDLRFVNAGTQSDAIGVKGCASSSGFTVKYLQGTTDVTTGVTSGTYRTGTLAAGASQVLKLKIAVSSKASKGKLDTCRVTATSVAAPTREDVVKAKVNAG